MVAREGLLQLQAIGVDHCRKPIQLEAGKDARPQDSPGCRFLDERNGVFRRVAAKSDMVVQAEVPSKRHNPNELDVFGGMGWIFDPADHIAILGRKTIFLSELRTHFPRCAAEELSLRFM